MCRNHDHRDRISEKRKHKKIFNWKKKPRPPCWNTDYVQDLNNWRTWISLTHEKHQHSVDEEVDQRPHMHACRLFHMADRPSKWNVPLNDHQTFSKHEIFYQDTTDVRQATCMVKGPVDISAAPASTDPAGRTCDSFPLVCLQTVAADVAVLLLLLLLLLPSGDWQWGSGNRCAMESASGDSVRMRTLRSSGLSHSATTDDDSDDDGDGDVDTVEWRSS